MNVQMQQSNFSHAKCLNCEHLGRIESFDPKTVPVEESNNEFIKITVTEKTEGIELMTVNLICPICNSSNIEAIYPNEVN